MKKHYIVTSVYKKTEIPLIDTHIKYLSTISELINVKFIVVANPEILKFVKESLTTYQYEQVEIIEGATSFFTPFDAGSYHHAANLKIALLNYNLSGCIVTFIDPDFIFINKSYLDVIKTIHKDYTILGMEWDRTLHTKWKDFVAPHFFSIDFSKINPNLISLNPELEKTISLRKINIILRNIINKSQSKFFIRKIVNLLIVPIYAFLRTNSSFDTLSKLRTYVQKNKIKVFLFKNIINKYNYIETKNSLNAFPPYLRQWLPKLIKYIPSYNSSSEKSFIQKYNPQEYKYLRPEEIEYQENLFALHMRTVKNYHKIIGKEGTGSIQLDFIINYLNIIDD